MEKGAFGRMPVVFQLNLADNKLETIANLAFDGLLQLIVLDLKRNNISNIPVEALKGKLLRTLINYYQLEFFVFAFRSCFIEKIRFIIQSY